MSARLEHLRQLHDRALDRVEIARRQLRAARADPDNDAIERFEAEVRECERDAAHVELQIIRAQEEAL